MTSQDEEPALTAFRKALDDQQRRGGGPFRLIAIASVLAAATVVVVGYMSFTGAGRKSVAVPAAARDTSLCEEMLAARTEANPSRLYFCSPAPAKIVKLAAGRTEKTDILANAVYELDVDGATRVSGLAAPGARYGWNRKVCTALAGPIASGAAPLTGSPVDPASC